MSYLSLPGRLLKAAMPACLVFVVLFAPEAYAAASAVRTSSPVFYTDSAKSPQCTYLSFNVTTSTAISDAWVTIGNFMGGYLSMGGGDDGIFHFGPMTAGETKPVFFYVCSSYAAGGTTAAQTYDITTYSGNPLFGGISQGLTSFSTTIDDSVIEAAANTVNTIWADINPSVLGATTSLTVDGDTGTIGCVNPPSTCSGGTKGPLTFNPATFANWRADSYELVATSIVLSVGNSGTYDNMLYIDNVASSSSTHYVATYYFRPVSTTASTTTLSPVSYLASGTQVKHTKLTSGAYAAAGGLLPILPAQNSMLLAKTVSHSTLPAQGGVVTYTLSATNSAAYDISLDSFIDILPAGATYVPGSTTFNDVSFADPGISGSTLTWSSLFNIPAGTTRTLIFQATLPATPGTYTNSATARIGNAVIDTTLSTSDNAPPAASTVVLSAPSIAKAFAPTAIAANGTSTLTLSITNPNATQTLNGIAVSDTLPVAPAGLVFASPPGAATTCPGAVLSVTGTTVAIAGGTLAAGQSCTVSINVTSAVNATYTNITGTVSSSNGGTGGTASASLTVTPKPTISKSFSVASIALNGTATLTFTITNNTAAAITGVTFDDLFPAGLVTANPPTLNPASPCGGTLSSWDGTTAGALSGTGGDPGIRLTGGAIATAGGTCTFTINVTSATAGVYTNTADGVDSNESSPAGPVSNTATLSVLGAPTVAKAFSPATIGMGQTSTLTVTLTNPNATAITGAAFTDTYPANVATAVTPNASTTCASGIVGSTAGSVSLSGATIPPGGSCTVSIDVTSSVVNLAGYVNTIAAGAVTTANAGSNAAPASATLVVNATPTIAKSFAFNPATGVATMSITITNNDTVAISALSFTDLFPTGMTTANPPAVTPAVPCGAGSSIQSWNGTVAGALSATGGDAGIKLTAGQLAVAASCTFTVNLAVNSLGIYTNQTSGVTGSFAGTGSASNTATWIAPSVGKTFTPNMVGPSDISRLVITITNPSLTTPLTGLAISDTYPTTATLLAGGTLAAALTSPIPNASNTCGGTVTATATGVTLSGGALAPGASCSIGVDVIGTNTTPAIYANTTGKVASNQGIGISGSDSLVVTNKPTLTKSFLTSPVTLVAGAASSVMRIVIENNAGVNLTAVSFSDTFPASPSQMRWVNTVANTCGGTLTDAAGAALVSGTSTGIKLTGGAITSAAVTCTIDITVSVSATGSYSNTTTGATSSANAVVGPASNTATLVAYLPAPTVAKSFANAGFQVNGTNALTITLTNPNATAITGVAFTDTYPANMLNAATPNLANTCGGTATAAAGANTLSISGGTIPASGSCTLTVDVTATMADLYTNTLAINAVTSTNANPGPAAAASASATAYLPPTLSKSFGAATIAAGSNTALILTLTNPVGNPGALTSMQVDDTFPSGLTLQNTTFTYNPAACGTVTKISGAASATGDNNIRFAVASLAAGASCEISANVTSTTPGIITNTTGAPSAAAPAALTGAAASANLTVSNAPSITLLKTVAVHYDPVNLLVNPKFIPGSIAEYGIIASNSGGPADNNSTVITDPVPANTALYVNDVGGAGSGPVLFTQGAASSTLTYTFTALNDMADDVSFSNDGGATWTAVPVAGASGCDATVPAITHIRVNPKGTFAGSAAAPNPSFQLTFRVCVQ